MCVNIFWLLCGKAFLDAILRQGKCRTTTEKVYYDDDEYNIITLISKRVGTTYIYELVRMLLETVINLIENYLTVNIDKIADGEWIRACKYNIMECFHVCGLGWWSFQILYVAHGLFYEI